MASPLTRSRLRQSLALLGLWAATSWAASPPKPVDPLTLRCVDLDGREHAVFTGDARDIVVLFFIAPECPNSNRYVPAMRALAADFQGPRIRLFGVYVEPEETLATFRQHAADYQLDFPLRSDAPYALVRYAGITRTPETVIADGTGRLIYRGRIDDRMIDFGKERPAPTREDVREILAALRAGERPPFRTTVSFGCSLSQPLAQP